MDFRAREYFVPDADAAAVDDDDHGEHHDHGEPHDHDCDDENDHHDDIMMNIMIMTPMRRIGEASPTVQTHMILGGDAAAAATLVTAITLTTTPTNEAAKAVARTPNLMR
jgi:hypothetical protein